MKIFSIFFAIVFLYGVNSLAAAVTPAVCDTNADVGEVGYFCQAEASFGKKSELGITKSNVDGVAMARAITAANLYCQSVIGNKLGEASIISTEVTSEFVETDSLFKSVAHVEFECFDEIL